MSKVSNDLNLLLQSFTGKASSSTSKTTPTNSQSVKNSNANKEYTPTRLQYSTDMKQIKHFELQSEYTEAKQNLESLKGIDPKKRPKSWSLLVSNATKKLKESSTELKDFKKDNPELGTPTKDLGQLLSTLETLKQKAPKSKYVLLTSDLVNEFKDGKYPAPLKVQQLLKDVSKVINTKPQSDPNFDSLESILIGFVPSTTPVKPLEERDLSEYAYSTAKNAHAGWLHKGGAGRTEKGYTLEHWTSAGWTTKNAQKVLAKLDLNKNGILSVNEEAAARLTWANDNEKLQWTNENTRKMLDSNDAKFDLLDKNYQSVLPHYAFDVAKNVHAGWLQKGGAGRTEKGYTLEHWTSAGWTTKNAQKVLTKFDLNQDGILSVREEATARLNWANDNEKLQWTNENIRKMLGVYDATKDE